MKTLKAKDKFKVGNFNIDYVWDSFQNNFGEPTVKPKKFEPKFIILPRTMLDSEILAEYRPEEMTLDELSYLLESKEGLLTNGYANIFYIRDKENTLWAVSAYWYAVDDGWSVYADSVGSPGRWSADDRVVSRNLTLRPSDPLDLETRILTLELQVEKLTNWANKLSLTPPSEKV